MTDRSKQCAEIVHTAKEYTADQDPQRNRQPAEHGGADRTGNGTCAGN